MRDLRKQFASITQDQKETAYPVKDMWPHQVRAVDEFLKKAPHSDTLCITSPTGGGKTNILASIINLCTLLEIPCVLYTNRKLLTKQMIRNLNESGIVHGVRAASLRHLQAFDELVQVSSMATEASWVLRSGAIDLHKAGVVLVDECHMQSNGNALRILRDHIKQGAMVVGLTATPLGINHLYKELFIAGKTSDLRNCGALVPAEVKCCHEMDASRVERVKTGEYSIGGIRKACWSQAIVGYVYEDWVKFNPDARQTLCFAPGVPESLHLAEMFKKRGVKVAHIDAKMLWIDGEEMKDDDQGTAREQMLDDWDAGEIKVVMNRFVMTQGVDRPNIYHGILATPVGSLKTYLQEVGRIMRRSHATPDSVKITDHGGSYWRHGSPNENRDWHSLWQLTEHQITEKREREQSKEPDKQALICPECSGARLGGSTCPHCGHVSTSRKRTIVQVSGQLKTVDGPFFVERPKAQIETAQTRWNSIYYAAKNSKSSRGMTFRQACGMYRAKYGQPVPKGLANMPIDDLDWSRRIRDVDFRQLTTSIG